MAFLLPSARNGRRGAGSHELHGGQSVQDELPILDGIVAKVVVAGCEKGVAVPVGHCAEAFAGHLNPLRDSIAMTSAKFSHLVAIDHIEDGVLGGLEQKMTMRSGLIGEQRGAAGADVGVTRKDGFLIEGREVVADGEDEPSSLRTESP